MGSGKAPSAAALPLAFTIFVGACRSGGESLALPGDSIVPPPVTLNVLFIGNSLTYFNDLPATMAEIAAAVGDNIRVAMVAGPQLSLMDQLAGYAAEPAIARGGWDFVVLQQGASTDSASRDELILATEKFDTLIRSVGARPALYMVWPPARQPDGFCATGVSYQTAATAVNGVFLPAGDAWQRALQRDPGLVLYDPDGIHPSPLGTYLAAITIYDKLTGHDVRQLPARAVVDGVALNLPVDTVRLLQEVAHSVSTAGPSNHGCNVN